MTASSSDTLQELKSSAWLIIAMGAISVVAGVLAIVYPEITLLALAIFTGVNLIVLSVLSLVDAFGSDVDGGTRTLSAILGVLGLIAGLVVLRRPGETLLVLILAIGIWLVVSGVVQLVRAFEDIENRALRMLVAGGEIVLGALLLILPDLSLRTVAVLAGISFILRGALALYAGWQLHRAGAAATGRVAPAA
jgi:uncharacterized membrane protein HdeD (DUF308 family)